MEPYGFIYKVTNKINGKTYIGKTTRNFDERYMYNIGLNTKNKLLKAEFEIFGEDAFEIIKEFAIAYSKDELDELEIKYIKEFDSLETGHGYNRNTGGTHGKATPVLRRELSKAHVGYVMPEEQKEKIRRANSGKNSHMHGVPKSDETKIKISESLKKRYAEKGSPNIGRRLSDETKEKLSKALRGRIISKESSQKTADALRGKPKTEIHKKHISEGRKGIVFSEEHKKHLSEARSGRKLSDEHRQRFAYSRLGKTNSDYQKQRVAEVTGKKVRRIDTGEIYSSICEAARKNNMSEGTVRNNCRGVTKTAKGIRFEFVL